MCNPRRVRVRVTEHVTEAWLAELTRTAQVRDRATAEARITQPFGSVLGEPARIAFERALGGDERWAWEDTGDRHSVDDGYVVYHRDTGELEMVAELSEVFEVEESVTRELRGTVQGAGSAEGTATYDTYIGQSEDDASRRARQSARNRAR